MVVRTDPGPNRDQLGFKEAVLSSFKFLHLYGFRPLQEESTLVRYESDKAFVDIYHGRGSFQLGVDIGRLDSSDKYGLEYIVLEAGKSAWEAEGFGRSTVFQVSSRKGVEEFVPRIAELVKKYGDPFLRGDPDFYDRLEQQNQRRSAEYVKQMELKRIREKADTAWHQKHYLQVAELYSSIGDNLTNVEISRLAYAEKHQMDTGVQDGQRVPKPKPEEQK